MNKLRVALIRLLAQGKAVVLNASVQGELSFPDGALVVANCRVEVSN